MGLVLISTLWLGGLGLVCGLALALAERRFGLPEDPRVGRLSEALPGVNCGGCGYPGCAEYARAMARGAAASNRCGPGGADAARRLAEILGVAAEPAVLQFAVVLCGGNVAASPRRFAYNGIADCAAAAAVAGGDKACTHGCLGYATCARVCPVRAIGIADGLARVRRDVCIACGKCVPACPRRLIRLVPANRTLHVLCRSHDRGARTRQVCRVGCIACRACVKPSDGAIAVGNNLAVVDYLQPSPGEGVAAVCPTGCIRCV
jgi:electron transport complex protein RnfB